MHLKTHLISIILLFATGAYCQNARFSQIYSVPTLLNPALSGKFDDGSTVQIGTLLSWQNSNTANVAHQNFYVDSKLLPQKSKSDSTSSSKNWINKTKHIGITLNHYQYGNDIIGFTQKTTPISAKFTSISSAFHFNITNDAKYYGGIGIQLTNAEGNLDETIGNDYNLEVSGGGFRYRKTNAGNFKNKIGYFTWSLGSYIGIRTEEHLLELGFSFFHLNQPKNDLTNDQDSKQRRRFSAFSNILFKLSEKKQLLFRNVYWDEGLYTASSSYKDSSYINAFYSGIDLLSNRTNQFTNVNFGLHTRNFQSSIFIVNLLFDNSINSKISYEIPINKSIHPANNAYRFELSFGYIFLSKQQKILKSTNNIKTIQ